MLIPKYLHPIDEMKRISRQELADNLDDILETVHKDNVGFVIKDDDGKPDVVLCPADWFHFCFDQDFGCIINSAVRYSLQSCSC